MLLELGYAKRHLGDEAIVLVANSHYGTVEQLPFDLRGVRTIVYQARPEAAPAEARKKLVQAFEGAIKSIAAVVRGDPVLAAIYPKTLNVVGQAEGMLRELIKAAGKQFDPGNITEDELGEICSSVDPNYQSPLIIEIGAKGEHRYASWLEYLGYWRSRSQSFTNDILVFSPFLKREHVALLMSVEQCHYLGFMSKGMWKYVEVAKRLKNYAEKVLARRASPF